MIQSMTGYGKSSVEVGNQKIIIEIKSLNSKAMDISTRIMPIYREKELEIRSLIASSLERGKVDFFLYTDNNSASTIPTINTTLFKQYYDQIREIAQTNSIPLPADIFYSILHMPDIYSNNQLQEQVSEEDWNRVMEAVKQAIDSLIEYRKEEGRTLSLKFEHSITNISNLLDSVSIYETERINRIKERIRNTLTEYIGAEYDNNRFEQELIYYIEKLDINEEKQRLSNHLNYFLETLNGNYGQGKKLGFIAQEMGREINTLGSKSNLAELQNIVVMMKDELEQIKEQVLNVM